MASREDSMGRLSKHVEKKTDNWSVGSKKKLKKSMEHKMKRIFVGILDLIEKEQLTGNLPKDVFEDLRSKVLNIGNDQIRNMQREIDDRYNVESLNYQVIFSVIGDN
jgi:hypothetical protein